MTGPHTFKFDTPDYSANDTVEVITARVIPKTKMSRKPFYKSFIPRDTLNNDLTLQSSPSSQYNIPKSGSIPKRKAANNTPVQSTRYESSSDPSTSTDTPTLKRRKLLPSSSPMHKDANDLEHWIGFKNEIITTRPSTGNSFDSSMSSQNGLLKPLSSNNSYHEVNKRMKPRRSTSKDPLPSRLEDPQLAALEDFLLYNGRSVTTDKDNTETQDMRRQDDHITVQVNRAMNPSSSQDFRKLSNANRSPQHRRPSIEQIVPIDDTSMSSISQRGQKSGKLRHDHARSASTPKQDSGKSHDLRSPGNTSKASRSMESTTSRMIDDDKDELAIDAEVPHRSRQDDLHQKSRRIRSTMPLEMQWKKNVQSAADSSDEIPDTGEITPTNFRKAAPDSSTVRTPAKNSTGTPECTFVESFDVAYFKNLTKHPNPKRAPGTLRLEYGATKCTIEAFDDSQELKYSSTLDQLSWAKFDDENGKLITIGNKRAEERVDEELKVEFRKKSDQKIVLNVLQDFKALEICSETPSVISNEHLKNVFSFLPPAIAKKVRIEQKLVAQKKKPKLRDRLMVEPKSTSVVQPKKPNKTDTSSPVRFEDKPNTRQKDKTMFADQPTLFEQPDTRIQMISMEKFSETGGLGKPWQKPLVFPKTGSNRARVDFDDLKRLDADEFLNDNLVEFFLRYHEAQYNEKNSNSQKKIYFFNTFFHSTLSQKSPTKQPINYDAVKRWTSKVNIFDYDFIIVPINENLHWYLAIICHPGKLLNSFTIKDDPLSIELDQNSPSRKVSSDLEIIETNEVPRVTGDFSQLSIETQPEEDGTLHSTPNKHEQKVEQKFEEVPMIIALDSLRINRTAAIKKLKLYLHLEAQDKLDVDFVEDPKGKNATTIPIQDNYCDCGLYLVRYVEKFLRNPDIFVEKLLQRFADPEDWPPAQFDAGFMRKQFRELVQNEYELQQNRAVPPKPAAKPPPKAPPPPMDVVDLETADNIGPSTNEARSRSTTPRISGHALQNSEPHPTLNSDLEEQLLHAAKGDSV